MTPRPRDRPNRAKPEHDELFEPVIYGPIDDIGDTTTFTPLRRGARMNADSIGDTNPYLLTGYRIYDQLPTGTSPEPLGSGRTVGILGEGALTRVYRILRDSPRGERAVKVMLPDVPAAVARASSETWNRLSRLSSPSLVKVYNVGMHNGLSFVETALYRGRSLGELLHLRGPFPAQVAAAAGACILDGLEACCVAPPADLRVLPRPCLDDLLLTDPGTIVFLDYLLAGSLRLDSYLGPDAFVQAIRYLPSSAAVAECSVATALYAFGALLYELLTAHAPFGGDSPEQMAASKAKGLRTPWRVRFGQRRRLAQLACACTAPGSSRDLPLLRTVRETLVSIAPEPASLLRALARDPAHWPAAKR